VAGVATAFGYDALNELVSAQLGPLKATWTYDAVGNRLKETLPLGTTNYSYDPADRLLAVGLAKFTYDNNGNQLTKTSGRLTSTYTYDAANRLVKALGWGMNSTFGYDGDGNRISQATGPGTYTYVNDVATALPVVLNEQGPDGNITYAYGLGLVEESSPAFNFFYHYDGLGSVVALTDATGKPRAAYAYDPWGNALLNISDSLGTKNKFRFTGEALDPGTGLYYLRARYYDPSIGRFSSRDRPVGSNAWPLASNPYLYALSNPIRYTDPSGFSAVERQQQLGTIDNTLLTASVLTTFGDNWEWIKGSLLKIACSAGLPFCGPAVGGLQVKEGLSIGGENTAKSQDAAIDNLAQHLKDGTTTVDYLVKQILGQSGYGVGVGRTPSELRDKIIESARRQGIQLTQEQIEKKEIGIFGR
jgi:RHS repeat-associated protein